VIRGCPALWDKASKQAQYARPWEPINSLVSGAPSPCRETGARQRKNLLSKDDDMALTNAELESISSDATKTIEGDIVWQEDEDRSGSVEFRAEVKSDAGWPLFVRGGYNRLIHALSYVLILKSAGRIYALDLGKDHHNPTCDQVGEKHKHRWSEQFRDKDAYVPVDITEPATSPVAVWRQFCAEAKLSHNETMHEPPTWQGDLFLWNK
jgi:hypothetical protein